MEIFDFSLIGRGNPRFWDGYLETVSITDSDAQRSVSPFGFEAEEMRSNSTKKGWFLEKHDSGPGISQ